MDDNEITEIMNMLQLEPEGNDHREQLAVLVASGQAKEMIVIDLTQNQVKKLNAGDVEKYFKRYETSLSSKICDAMVDTFLELSCKALAHFRPVDRERLLGE